MGLSGGRSGEELLILGGTGGRPLAKLVQDLLGCSVGLGIQNDRVDFWVIFVYSSFGCCGYNSPYLGLCY